MDFYSTFTNPGEYGMPFPGQPNFGQAAFSPFSRPNMFGGGGPRFTGPFNFQMPGMGGLGPMLQMTAPLFLNSMMQGQGRMPFQFFPSQNVYDQIQANHLMQQRQMAAQAAAMRDQAQLSATMGGATSFFTGRAPTQLERAQHDRFASGLSSMMPILSQFLGPDVVDQLHGSRGSATVFAQQIHSSMRQAADPVTGRIGLSGASVSGLTNSVYERMFGQGVNLAERAGLSAGQAGMMASELQARGLLGRGLGEMSFHERLRTISQNPNLLDSGAVARAAEQTPEILAIRNAGRTPTAEEMSTARGRVSDTRRRMMDAPGGISPADLERMPGGQDLVRAAEGGRTAQRLTELSGAVKAMRDIFGDMGHEGTMREIINGIDALTQGGLATLPRGQLESIIRRTQVIAQNMEGGLPALMGLTAQAGNMADRFGVARPIALQAALNGAQFGLSMNIDNPAWGNMDRERATLVDTQLRVAGAASPAGNQVSALLRMRDNGVLRNMAPGSELAAVMEAIRNNSASYNFGGRTGISINHAPGQLLDLLQRDASVSSATAMGILSDTSGNQEFAHRYGTDVLNRANQRAELADYAGTSLGWSINAQLGERGARALAGVGGIDAITAGMGAGLGADFLAMPENIRSNAIMRQAQLGNSIRTRLRAQIASRAPAGTTAAQIDQMVNDTLGGTPITTIAEAAYAQLNEGVRQDLPLVGSAIAMQQANDQNTINGVNVRNREDLVRTGMASALGSLGAIPPIARIVDAFRNARPGTSLMDIVTRGLGGIDLSAEALRDPTGLIGSVLNLTDSTRAIDPHAPGGLAQAETNIRNIHGLVEGGARARIAIDAAEAGSAVIGLEGASETERRLAIRRARTMMSAGNRGLPIVITDQAALQFAQANGLLRRTGIGAGLLEQLYQAEESGGAAQMINERPPDDPAAPGAPGGGGLGGIVGGFHALRQQFNTVLGEAAGAAQGRGVLGGLFNQLFPPRPPGAGGGAGGAGGGAPRQLTIRGSVRIENFEEIAFVDNRGDLEIVENEI